MPSLGCDMLDLVPWLGIKSRPPALGAQELSHWTTRKVLFLLFFFNYNLYEKIDVSWTYWDNHFTIFVNQTIVLYTLKLYSDLSWLFLSKTGKTYTPKKFFLFVSWIDWFFLLTLPYRLHNRNLKNKTLLPSRFSRVRLCATPKTAAHQAPPSLGFSRQEHWSGLPFPSTMQESEKWKWSRSVMSDSQRPHGLQPTRLLHPWDFPGKSTGVGCHCLLWNKTLAHNNFSFFSIGLSHFE